MVPISDFWEFDQKSEKCKVEFSQKQFLRNSCLATFITEVLLKNFIQRALFFNNVITFSQVQTNSINFYFCFCVYSFDRKNKSLYYAKVSLVALKCRERIFDIIHDIP